MNLPVHGVDISRYQSKFDWVAAAKAGVQFAYHKVTEARSYPSNYIELYHQRRAAAEKAGVAWGGYHFARPVRGGGAEEARYFLTHLRFRVGDCRPMLDLETTGGLSRAELTAWVGDFVRTVERATGHKPIIYLSRQIPLNDTFGCLLWVPRYSDSNTSPHPLPAPWSKYALWQFSNGVYGRPDSVAGLGHVDLNTFGSGFGLKDLLTGPKEKPTMSKPVKATKQTPSAAKMIRSAAEEVGYREGSNNANKFAGLAGHANNAPWCATFLEGVSDSIGMRDLIPEGQAMASCDLLFQSFQKRGRWSEYPAVGAFFFLGQAGSGSVVNGKRVDLYHVGLVYAYDDDYIYTIEGNTNDDGSANGNGVYARKRARRNSSVHVYAYPDYKEGVLSADPAWRDRAPSSPAEPPKNPVEAKFVEAFMMHASLQFSDTRKQQEADAERIFARAEEKGAWWVTGTEAGEQHLWEIVTGAAERHGYRFHRMRGNWVAVQKKLVKKGTWKAGDVWIMDNDKVVGKGHDPAFPWVKFECALPGVGVLAVAGIHYPTQGRTPSGPNHWVNKVYAEHLGDWGETHGKGKALAFVGGDFNMPDNRPIDLFFGEPFTTYGDALKKWPNTGHGAIDALAKWDSDGRVTVTGYTVLNDKRFFLNTDHFLIEGTVQIALLKDA